MCLNFETKPMALSQNGQNVSKWTNWRQVDNNAPPPQGVYVLSAALHGRTITT